MKMEWAIDGLAVIGAVTCLYWAVRLLIGFLSWIERSEIERQAKEATAGAVATAAVAGAATVVAADVIPPEHVAAIAAAIAMIGGHRVVHIQDESGTRAWTSEGRWLHQTSHRTH